MKNKISKSVKKFIRTQKAQIRRQFSDTAKQDKMIQEIYERINTKK